MHVCIYAHMHACVMHMHICMCDACMHAHICTFAYMPSYMHMNTCIHMSTQCFYTYVRIESCNKSDNTIDFQNFLPVPMHSTAMHNYRHYALQSVSWQHNERILLEVSQWCHQTSMAIHRSHYSDHYYLGTSMPIVPSTCSCCQHLSWVTSTCWRVDERYFAYN